jgi:hypothetical protein
MKINVVKRVDVHVTPDDVKEMIKERVLAHDPDITIASIDFVRKLNPQRIEIDVDAYCGTRTPVEPTEPEKAEPLKEEVIDPLLPEPVEPLKEEVVEEPVKSVADIFNMPS